MRVPAAPPSAEVTVAPPASICPLLADGFELDWALGPGGDALVGADAATTPSAPLPEADLGLRPALALDLDPVAPGLVNALVWPPAGTKETLANADVDVELMQLAADLDCDIDITDERIVPTLSGDGAAPTPTPVPSVPMAPPACRPRQRVCTSAATRRVTRVMKPPRKRRPQQPVPDDAKDARYFAYRRKNTETARIYRARKKAEREAGKLRLQRLKAEGAALAARAAELEVLVGKYRELHSDTLRLATER